MISKDMGAARILGLRGLGNEIDRGGSIGHRLLVRGSDLRGWSVIRPLGRRLGDGYWRRRLGRDGGLERERGTTRMVVASQGRGGRD
ncbi:hypothetical protein HAX54_051658 [Datura stramonium]|uniref:Uncharacterized protein n=1 Tax=Datura stramonium TaxID=4076 RepID=A0ABS8SYS3_DATST|nr:hypothetical protein [Datura stramonium]